MNFHQTPRFHGKEILLKKFFGVKAKAVCVSRIKSLTLTVGEKHKRNLLDTIFRLAIISSHFPIPASTIIDLGG